MLEIYKEKQPLFFNYAEKTIKDNKISHAYLIETNGVEYGFDIAISLSKAFLCPNNYLTNKNCGQCLLCKNIDNNNYPELKIIETDAKEIKKEQVLEVQDLFSTKPIYGKYLIYIIKHANLLNKSSANTILKFLEEPNENIIAILLTDNIYTCIDTIVSRCQVLSLIPEEKTNLNIYKKYFDGENLNDFIIEETNKIFDFYAELEKEKEKLIISTKTKDYKQKIDLLLTIGLFIYMDVLNVLLSRGVKNNKMHTKELEEFAQNNTINDIIKKIDIINQFLKNSNSNVNKELFLDNFIITFGGGNK